MIISGEVILLCDFTKCDSYLTGGPENGYRPAKDEEEARRLAEGAGWSYINGQDLCQFHTGG